jgi:ABC-2 type transport system ATP-binding protein
VLTTHDLRDVERLCRRLILIERGTVLFDGSIEELRSRYAVGRELVMDVVRADGPLDLPGVDEVRREGSRVWLAVYPDLEEIVRRIFAEQTGSRA